MSCVFEPITVHSSLHGFEKKDAYAFSIVPMRKCGMKNGLPRSYCSNFILSRQSDPDLSFYDQLGEVDS